MKLLTETVEDLGTENGWKKQRIRREFEADWETGAAHFRRLGYVNWLTLPSTIIPMRFNREKVMEFFPNAVVMIAEAEAYTYNQPRGWTGEVQIPVADRQNLWRETVEQSVLITISETS